MSGPRIEVLLFGGAGRLGSELLRCAPTRARLTVPARRDVDIASEDQVKAAVESCRPDIVINAAGFTDVDGAEDQEQAAFAANSDGPGWMAQAVSRAGGRLVHLSTDFVFPGRTDSKRYLPEDAPEPLSVYGTSKLEGERRVLDATGGAAVVVRSAWIHSVQGGDFVETVLRLHASHERIRVVGDQIGSPTWARSLAEAVWQIAERPDIRGIQHWTNAGQTSRFDYAVAIQEEGVSLGLLDRPIPIEEVTSEEFPTPARRPKHCVLDCTRTWSALGSIALSWRQALRRMMVDLAARKIDRERQ